MTPPSDPDVGSTVDSASEGVPLRALVVEDAEDDAILLVRALRRAGYAPSWERVDTRAAMEAALDRAEWDVVLSDYVVPGFGAPVALLVLKERGLDVPFIVVSGAIGEDRAVAAMRAGAHDYVMKDNLARLGPAIRREIAEVANRRERRRAEAELRASEERFRMLVEATLEGIVVHDRGQHLLANPAFARMLGYTPEEVVGKTTWDFIAPESHATVRARMAEGTEEPYEAVGIRKDGSRFDVEILGKPLPYQARTVRVVAVRDITARKRAEASLRLLVAAGDRLAASLRYEETLIQVANLAVEELADLCLVDVLDDDGGLRRVAAAHRDPAQRPVLEAIRARSPRWPGDDHPVARVLRTEEAILHADLSDELLVSTARDEEHLWLARELAAQSLIVVPLSARGRPFGTMSLLTTTPGRQFTADDLALAQALAQRCSVAAENARLFQETEAAVRLRDDFLAAVAHDLKNPLTAIKSRAQLLGRRAARSDTPTDDRLVEGLLDIDGTASKMVGLLDELLDVARLQVGRPLELTPRPTDAVALARVVAAAHARVAPAHAISVLVDDTEIVGEWDPARLERVLDNLVGNAVKYSPDGGPVRMLLGRESGDAEMLVLRVSDTGVGIPAADLSRVFDRFHRGANVVGRIHGTGIGLAVTRHIVEQHGGTVGVESQEGRGTTFTVRLPLRAVPDGETTPDDAPTRPVTGTAAG